MRLALICAVALVLATTALAADPASAPAQAESGKVPPLPSWVPAPGNVAVVTKGAGVLVNNYRDVVAPYYEPFYAIKNVNDYSGAAVNPYWGPHGALVGFGGGHASTNDNSVWALELSVGTMRFRRLVDPTAFFGTGVDAATKARNAGNNQDWGAGHQVQTDPDYGEVLVNGTHQVGVPAACHSYDALEVIGPEEGGAACGSLILVARSELNYGGGRHALAAHIVDFKQDTGADGSYRWRRFADAHEKLGGVPNVVTAKVSRQNRIYWMGSKAAGAPRWFDLSTKTYGARGTNGALINEGGSNTESMTYLKERDLLLFAGQSDGNLRIQYLTVAPGDNASGWAVAKLDKPLSMAGNPSHIAWCPDNSRLIVGAIEGDDNCVYEIQVSDPPVAPWVCTRVPFPAGQSIPWARRDTWPKGWEYNPKVKAIVYISGVRIDGDDSVYVYRPRGT